MQGRSQVEGEWNLGVVMEALGANLDAEQLALELDHPEFTLPNPRAFLLLMALWRGTTSGKQFPLQTIMQRSWSNVAGQLEFLKYATAAPPEVFSFEGAQRKLPPLENLQVSAWPLPCRKILLTCGLVSSRDRPACAPEPDRSLKTCYCH